MFSDARTGEALDLLKDQDALQDLGHLFVLPDTKERLLVPQSSLRDCVVFHAVGPKLDGLHPQVTGAGKELQHSCLAGRAQSVGRRMPVPQPVAL